MNERLRVAIVTGCLFVIGLHLESGARLLREVWQGPYGGASAVDAPLASPEAPAEERGLLASAAAPEAKR